MSYNIMGYKIGYKGIVAIITILASIFLYIAGQILQNPILFTLSTIMSMSVILAVAVSFGVLADRRKKSSTNEATFTTYKLAGPVLAWLMIPLMLNAWNPEILTTLMRHGEFWAFQIGFFLILVFLGRTTISVLSIRLTIITLTAITLVGLMANFIPGGPEFLAEIENGLKKTTIHAKIARIQTSDKDRRIELLSKRLEGLEQKSQERPLQEAEKDELQRINQELEKIYPKPRPEPKQLRSSVDRRLRSGSPTTILEIPAGEGFYRPGVRLEKDDRITIKSLSDKPALLRNADTGSAMLIPHKGFSQRCYTTGKLAFKMRSEPTRIAYKISSR